LFGKRNLALLQIEAREVAGTAIGNRIEDNRKFLRDLGEGIVFLALVAGAEHFLLDAIAGTLRRRLIVIRNTALAVHPFVQGIRLRRGNSDRHQRRDKQQVYPSHGSNPQIHAA
jgi:hypothetical protein